MSTTLRPSAVMYCLSQPLSIALRIVLSETPAMRAAPELLAVCRAMGSGMRGFYQKVLGNPDKIIDALRNIAIIDAAT